MIKKLFTAVSLSGIAWMLFRFFQSFQEKLVLPELARHYLTSEPKELGAANVVTSVVVAYRGLDTLGEVTILFASAAVVGLLFHLTKNERKKRNESSELLKTAASHLFPLIVLFGTYVFVNGHLTPGGGFQGGAIIASAFMLLLLANPNRNIATRVLVFIESISGLTYVALGTLGAALVMGGFLDVRIFELGTYGHLFSAGLIPVIYILIGLKVGSELSSVVANMHGKGRSLEEKS